MKVSTRLLQGHSTVNAAEIAFFSRLSQHWWNESGEFSLLHRMNPVRVGFIRDKVLESRRNDIKTWEDEDSLTSTGRSLSGMTVLDVGCGGGLLAESLARLGARTLGIDASESNIKIASLHASQDPYLSGSTGKNTSPILRYTHTSSEALLTSASPPPQYDVVCSMEVLEHVDNAPQFLKSCAELVKPGGHLFLSTIARTPFAHLLTITMAEDILRLVSQGTHTYSKFIQPSELVTFFRDDLKWITDHGVRGADSTKKLPRAQAELRGMAYMPFSGNWALMPKHSPFELDCNYLFWVRKPL